MKKVSILIYSLAGGGAERVVSILLKELKEFDVTLVLMSDKIDYEIPKNSKIVYLEKSNPKESGIKKLLKLPLLALKYEKFLKENEIDISLSFMNRPNYINILSKLFGSKVKTIISERANPSLQYSYKNLLSKINKFLIKNLYPKADLIIANSNGNRIDLINNFAIKSNFIKTMHNPFDLEKIEKLSSESVEFDFSKLTFITIGRLDIGKNHEMMIKAFAKVETNANLIILGEGELREKLLTLIKELNMKEKIFLMGFDSNPYKYLSKSDVFLFSSSHEGFPNVLVEALACGLPTISTDCNREILAPNSEVDYQLLDKIELSDYGILTPVKNELLFKEAIEKLLDKELRDKYKSLSKKRAKEFDKEKIVKEFIDILN